MERIKLNIQKFASNDVDVKIGADTSKAQENIKKLITTIDGLKTKLQASNIVYGNNSKSIDVLDQRNKILNSTLSAQHKLVKNLEAAIKSQNTQNEKGAIQAERLAKQKEKVNNAMILNNARIDKNNQKIKEQVMATEEVTTETYTFKDAIGELNDAFAGLNIRYVINMLKRLATSLYTDFITKAVDTSEELNLFNVVFDNMQENGKKTFSELGRQATSFQKRLNEAFGTNMKETMRYQGLFQAMGESAGLKEEIAMLMSENMTKLAYDLASLYNTTETKAAESLRAGVYAGQTKPLRNYGIDVTQTSFKPLMEELGIEKSVSELTQAEKEILRYITTLNQAKNAMGDFANTIESPANQLKVLRQQFYEMQAAIGNLFMGAFSRILPYANAVIMVIKEVARAIAGFFGIEMQDFNSGLVAYAEDLNEYEEALDGVGGAAGGASGAVKELKRQVLGFDQINNLTTPTPSSGGSGGGGGGGAGVLGAIDDKLLAALKGYNNGMDQVRMKATQIRDKMMEILGFTRNINGEWEWGGFSKLIKNFSKWFGDLDFKGKVLVVGGMVTAFASLFSVIKSFGKLTGLTGLFKAIGSAGTKLFATGATATAAGGTAGAVIAGIVGETAMVITANHALENLYQKIDDLARGNGWKFDWLDKLELGMLAITMKTSNIVPVFAAVRTAVEAFSSSIKPVHFEDILDLANASDKTKETLGVVLKDYEQFTKDLNLIAVLNKTTDENGVLSYVISQENVDELKRLFNEATQVTVTSLEEQKTNALNALDGMKDQLGDKYEEMRQNIIDHYDSQIKDANGANEEINKIIENALNERGSLTQEEMDKINEIRAKAQDSAIDQLSDSEAEALAIRQTMKDKAVDLTTTEASEILTKSAELRDKTIEDAKTQYDEILKQAEKLKAAGVINDDEYKKMREAAEKTYNETVDNAIKQHDEVYNEFVAQNEDIAQYIDKDTGGIIPKWKAYWNKLVGFFKTDTHPKLKEEGGKSVDAVQEGIDQKPNPNIEVDTPSQFQLQNQIDTARNGVKGGSIYVGVSLPTATTIQNALNSALGGANAMLKITKNAMGGVFANGSWQPIQAYANGGVPSGGQLFMAREAGPELVGKIGKHTAVMNNNQIVDSVKAGVYEAVSAAMSEGGMGSVQIDLHTDEGVVVDRINRITRQTGNCPIEI